MWFMYKYLTLVGIYYAISKKVYAIDFHNVTFHGKLRLPRLVSTCFIKAFRMRGDHTRTQPLFPADRWHNDNVIIAPKRRRNVVLT